MKFEEIRSPDELLNFMRQNIRYGFVDKGGHIYKDVEEEDAEKHGRQSVLFKMLMN